jgi:hypothetical protein
LFLPISIGTSRVPLDPPPYRLLLCLIGTSQIE